MTDIKRGDDSALNIVQAFLDTTSTLEHGKQAAAYADHTFLPYVYRTEAGEGIIETKDDMVSDILKVGHWLDSHGVTDYHRIARKARFLADDVIEALYVTYALRHAISMIEPYANRMLLRLVDGQWLVALSEHELADPLYVDLYVKPKPGIFSGSWADLDAAITRDETQALAIYQTAIDAMTDRQNQHDFDGWVAQFTMPHHVHYNNADHAVDTAEDVFPFFDSVQHELRRHPGAALSRTASFAAFVTDDRLLG